MIAAKLPEGQGFLIRARYQLADCFAMTGDARQGEAWRKAAEAAEAEFEKAAPGATGGAVRHYESFIPWMLW